MNSATINVARDFGRYPGGRFKSDGKYSGEAFRDDILVPKLKEFDEVVIELDGTLGYGSSFLDEAFGGLVRIHKFTPDVLLNKLHILSKDTSLILETKEYITKAKR